MEKVKELKLGDVCVISRGKRAKSVDNGAYEAYGAGRKATKRTDRVNTEAPCIRVTAKATIGDVYLHTEPFWAEEACVVLRPREVLTLTYLYHWLKKNQPILATLKKGDTLPSLDIERFKNLVFELPSVAYQQAVNDFLSVLELEVRQLWQQKGVEREEI